MDKVQYKIGTTSYIYPEDLLANVEKLKDKIDDIEILYFERGYRLENKVLDKLALRKKEHAITYTIHLPLDLDFASADKIVRSKSIEDVRAIIKECRALKPSAYILHLNKKENCVINNYVKESLSILLSDIEEPAKLCIENVDYPLEDIDELIEEFGVSLCLDLGHFISHEYEFEKYFSKYIKNTKVIHLYSTDVNHRHLSLKQMNNSTMEWFKNFIRESDYRGIITLEVFSKKDLLESYKIFTGKILELV